MVNLLTPLSRLIDHTDEILAACKKDLGKGEFETAIELDWVTNDCIFICKKLDKWAADEKAADVPLTFWAVRPKIRKDPLGMVLVIGTFNYPLMLSLLPVIGALAAGNTVVLKPSENAPHVAVALERVISSALDPSSYRVVQGGIAETSALLDQKWDKICYTGSTAVGTIIAKKAAETLTPYTLELGGRNAAIVTKNANVKLAARRLTWGKTQNAGQVCISQNYNLVQDSVVDEFVAAMKNTMAEFFPQGTRNTDDFGRIINLRQFSRIRALLASTKGKIVYGGDLDEEDLYISPTVILVSSPDDPILQDESFGPLIPILPFSTLESAIKIAQSIDSTPLGFYPFGSDAEVAKMLNEIRSGGVSINDGFIHGAIQTLAFGGVGSSGQGAYHGKASFDCFTHHRSITKTPYWAEKLFEVRYPPYAGKLKMLRMLGSATPDFDREGKVVTLSWLRSLLGLGAKSPAGGLIRYIVVLTGKANLYDRKY